MATTPKPSNAVLPNGHKMGRYTIMKKLSSGGFGVVYLARRSDGHVVALKEFLPSIIPCRPQGSGVEVECTSEYDAKRFNEGLRAFFREADTLARIQNPRIIPIWDVFKDNGTAYFAMPVERGGTLQTLIRLKTTPVSERALRGLFVEACKGVEALHEGGLLHLDIKPSNLWVRPDSSVVVLDLGASRWEDEQVKSSQMARTPGFAAPEQHSSLKKGAPPPVSAKTDVYGLCASLLSCLDAQPPRSAPERRAGDHPISWTQLGHVSSALLNVIDTGMSLQPQFRYRDVASLRSALEHVPRLPTGPRWPETLSRTPWPQWDAAS